LKGFVLADAIDCSFDSAVEFADHRLGGFGLKLFLDSGLELLVVSKKWLF
jgi:hypothetical protein